MFRLLFKKQYKTILFYILFFFAINYLLNHSVYLFNERYTEDQQRYMASFDLNDKKTFFQTLEEDTKEAVQIVSDIQMFNSYDDFDKEKYADLLDPFLLLTGNTSYATYDMLVWQKNMLKMPGKYTKTIADDEHMLWKLNDEMEAQRHLAENIENLIELSKRGLRRNDYKYPIYEDALQQLESIDTNPPIQRTLYVEKILNHVTSDYMIYALILFSVFATFSGASQSKMSHTILISKMGMRRFAKTQIGVNVLLSLLGFAAYYLIQFTLSGGFQFFKSWSLPVQAINGYEYVMFSFSALEYLFFLLFTKALFSIVVALLSSLLSLACKNNILSALLHFMVCGIWYFLYTETQLDAAFQTVNMLNSTPHTLFTGGGNFLVTYFPYFMVGSYPFFYGHAYILLLLLLALLLFGVAILFANKLTARIGVHWNLKLLFATKFAKRQVR